MLFGRDIEADANSRSNGRSMFDGDLLVHGDVLVCLLTCTCLAQRSSELTLAGKRAGLHLPHTGNRYGKDRTSDSDDRTASQSLVHTSS